MHLRVWQCGEQGGMGFHRGSESVAQGHAVGENVLARPGFPGRLYVVNQGQHILGGLWPVIPIDLILGRQMADKGFPGVREFIPFDVEVRDRAISGNGDKILLDCTRVSSGFLFPTGNSLSVQCPHTRRLVSSGG